MLSAMAAVALLRSGLADLGVLATVAAGLCAFGFISGFSIGLPILAAGAALVAFVLVRGAKQTHGWLASGGGLLLGFSAAFVLLMSSSPPAVRCGPRGQVTTSTGYWPRSGSTSSSGRASGASGGRSSGTLTTGSMTVHYRCDNDRLTEFRVEQGG